MLFLSLLVIFFLKIIDVAVSNDNSSTVNNSSNITGTTFNYTTKKAWGVNLGNWLILEKWMDPSIFEMHAPNASDEWSFCQQAAKPAEALQTHWNSYITEMDFIDYAYLHINHLRIPVGYWTFIQPGPNEPYVSPLTKNYSDQYGQLQKAQLERILGLCDIYNMDVIIDLHGLPGSQNGYDGSGRKGIIGFFTEDNIKRSLQTVQAVVDWVNALRPEFKARISAIEVGNEILAQTDKEIAITKQFYIDAYRIVSKSLYKVYTMFSDSFFNVNTWNDTLSSLAGNDGKAVTDVVLDVHRYYGMPKNVSDSLSITKSICRSGHWYADFQWPVYFGEWSLASGVHSTTTTDEDKAWLKQLLHSQLYLHNENSGGAFWSMRAGPDAPTWSFRTLMKDKIVDNTTFVEPFPKGLC